jgi:hypothetical protein
MDLGGDDRCSFHWYSGCTVHRYFEIYERIGVVVVGVVLVFTDGSIEWRFRFAVRAQYVHLQCLH